MNLFVEQEKSCVFWFFKRFKYIYTLQLIFYFTIDRYRLNVKNYNENWLNSTSLRTTHKLRFSYLFNPCHIDNKIKIMIIIVIRVSALFTIADVLFNDSIKFLSMVFKFYIEALFTQHTIIVLNYNVSFMRDFLFNFRP